MTEEQKKERPRPSVGVYVVNKKGEVLMIRGKKWQNQWVPVGGHIEHGETPEQTALREVKEELGLNVQNPEILKRIDLIDQEEYSTPGVHFLAFEIKMELVDENQEINSDKREVNEYRWFEPGELVKQLDIQKHTKEIIKEFFVENKVKHSFFHKKCQHCEKFKNEAEEYKGGWQRAQADYSNLKKEIEQMRSEWVRMSEQQILEDFIPVYDNLKKSLTTDFIDTDNTDNKLTNWKKGIEYIMKQFWKVMQDHEVEEIKTVGEIFNPELHEAIAEEESDLPEHTIVKEVEAGYTMKGKVIKVAKVVVAKNKE